MFYAINSHDYMLCKDMSVSCVLSSPQNYEDTLQNQVLDSSGCLVPRGNVGTALPEAKLKDFQDEQIGQLYELMLESTKPNSQFDIQENKK